MPYVSYVAIAAGLLLAISNIISIVSLLCIRDYLIVQIFEDYTFLGFFVLVLGIA